MYNYRVLILTEVHYKIFLKFVDTNMKSALYNILSL